MLNFDLNQNPPTAEEIAAERKDVERKIANFKRKAWISSIVVVIAVVSILIMIWQLGWVRGEKVAYFAAVAVAFAASVAACIGVAAGLVASTIGVIVRIETRLDYYKTRLSSLSDIAPPDCEQLLTDCLANPDCEAYRQKVAAMGRKPVVAEATMIREWAVHDWALAADREKGRITREQERREGIACALASSREPLTAEALAAFNAEGGNPCGNSI